MSTKLAKKRLLVGVCHHVPPQILLVLGGKAAGWTLVRTQIWMQLHVGLKTCNKPDDWRLSTFKTYYTIGSVEPTVETSQKRAKSEKAKVHKIYYILTEAAIISIIFSFSYLIYKTVNYFVYLKLTFTSGQEAEVKSQSGHLKVFASKCALLWFSMSERPWKDSMHIRQENLLVFTLGELTVVGEAGASLLSWWKTDTVREGTVLVFSKGFQNGFFSYLHLLKDTIRQSWRQVDFVTFQVFCLGHFDSWRTTDLPITAVKKQ